MVEWPRFNQGCCGFQQNVPGSFGHHGIDMSWLSNFSDPTDAFLQCLGWNGTAAPFVALVDHDHYGAQVGMLHGHGTPFNKLYSNGNSKGFGWSQGPYGWNGCFVELQIGVAPSQLHSFPLPSRSSHHHTEFFQLLEGIERAERLYSDDYAEAVAATADFVNGPRGVPHELWEDMDAWTREVAQRPLGIGKPGGAEILFNGSAFGGLHAVLSGARPPDSVVYYEKPLVDYESEDLSAWHELLHAGTFSSATLLREPVSFVVGSAGDLWLDRLTASAAAHGWTWLHHLHVGFEAVERHDWPTAKDHLHASIAMRRSAHALRTLAVIEFTNMSQRIDLYQQAWAAAKDVKATDPVAAQLRTNLAGEIAQLVYRTADAAAPAEAPALWATLHELLTDFAREGVKVDTTAAGGQIAVASAAVALASGDFDAALQRLARHHFAHYDHAPRPALTDLWLRAQVAKEEAARGRPLTVIETKHVKFDPNRAPPETMGAIDVPLFSAPSGVSWP